MFRYLAGDRVRRIFRFLGMDDFSIRDTIEGISEKQARLRESVCSQQREQQSRDFESQSACKGADNKTVRKCDRHIMPILCWIFVLTYLDRMSIGNARIQGLEEDLNMKGNQFNIASTIFLVPFVVLELPSNLILKYIPPSIWVSSLIFLWGVTTICMGVVKTYSQLLCLRFFLGVFEAGFVPACIYLISMYYKCYEVQWRVSLFYSSAVISGAIGGFLAYGFGKMDGFRGYRSWRWLFIVEGVITVVTAVASLWLIADEPERARFLTEDERKVVQERIKLEFAADSDVKKLDRQGILRILLDWKLWVSSIFYLACSNNGYALGLFAPTIIHDLGWSAQKTQLMTVPACMAICAVGLLCAWLSGRMQHRFTFAIAGCIVAVGAYIILLVPNTSVLTRYFAIILAGAGGSVGHAITLGWSVTNFGGRCKKNFTAAVMVSIGNCGGFIASNIFMEDGGPRYIKGFCVTISLMVMAVVLCAVYFVGLWHENLKRDRGERDYRYRLSEEELRNLGDDHPSFRFSY